MSQSNNRRFRAVNPTLGKAPKLGPFPADQIFPWAAICLMSYWVAKLVFGLSWLWTGVIAAWGISTWWVLTGSRSWKFLSKFLPTPIWVRGYGRYRRVLGNVRSHSQSSQLKKYRR